MDLTVAERLERQQDLANRRRELAERFDNEDIEQENADFAEVLGTEAGRRIFAAILGRGHFFGTVFDKSGGDPTKLAFETGRRDFTVKLYQKANLLQPALVLKAIEERNAKYASRKRQMDALDEQIK